MARKRTGRPGIYLHQTLLESDAFRSLSAIDIQVLFAFLGKRRITSSIGGKKRDRKVVANNGGIVFSFPEAEARGWKRSTFGLCLKRLQERGFVTCIEAGGLNQGQEKRCTKWRVNVAADDEPGQRWMEWRFPESKQRDGVEKRIANLKQFRTTEAKKVPPHKYGAGPSQNHGSGHPKKMGRGSGGTNPRSDNQIVDQNPVYRTS